MVAHPFTTISPSSVAGATARESLLSRYISASVRKGEQAEERANQAREKAEQHFTAAGARQIIENVAGFFSTLNEWSRAEISRAGNHKIRIGTSLREHTGGNADPSQERTDQPSHTRSGRCTYRRSHRAHLLRAWRRWHVEQFEEALADVHADVMSRLMAQLEELRSARELVDFISAQDWNAVDADSRVIALHEINKAIIKVRERMNEKEPINDPLPVNRRTPYGSSKQF